MRRDTKGAINVLYVEPNDEKQTVLDALSLPKGRKVGTVIVLPERAGKAFQSPKDFHDIKLRKRQEDLPIVFVIPNDSLTQWARMNGFSVYPSLEALIKSNRVKPSSPSSPHLAVGSSSFNDSFSMPLHEHDDYPVSFIPPMSSLNVQERFHPRVPDPVTPLPLHADIFPAPPANPLLNRPTTAPPPEIRSAPKYTFPFKQQRLLLILTIVIIGVVLAATLLVTQRENIFPNKSSKTPNIIASTLTVGQMFFSSSGQIDKLGSVGMNDIVKLSLSHLTSPARDKKYYAWLRDDSKQSDGEALFLGSLDVSPQGTAQLTYTDQLHRDLLVTKSRVLITEEDASVVPIVPSPDTTAWRYLGSIYQVPNPKVTNQYSLLDHIRHLLAAEPTLEDRGLHGGLSLWLYRNTKDLLEWTGSAQNDQGNIHAVTQMRQQIIRVLDYLDGVKNVAEDVPPKTPVIVDPVQGSVGLLQLHAEQTPSSYMQQVGFHLSSITDSPGGSPYQQRLAIQLSAALNYVHEALFNAHTDAKQLIAMSDSQLMQSAAQTLLNDMATQVNNAYVGTTDPATNTEEHGVSWIYMTMQSLATIDIQASAN